MVLKTKIMYDMFTPPTPPRPPALSHERRLTHKGCYMYSLVAPVGSDLVAQQTEEQSNKRAEERSIGPSMLHQHIVFLLPVRLYGRYFPERPPSMWMAQNPSHTTGSEPTMEDYWEVCKFMILTSCPKRGTAFELPEASSDHQRIQVDDSHNHQGFSRVVSLIACGIGSR